MGVKRKKIKIKKNRIKIKSPKLELREKLKLKITLKSAASNSPPAVCSGGPAGLYGAPGGNGEEGGALGNGAGSQGVHGVPDRGTIVPEQVVGSNGAEEVTGRSWGTRRGRRSTGRMEHSRLTLWRMWEGRPAVGGRGRGATRITKKNPCKNGLEGIVMP
eukprot:Gb_28507 [translate_table: standard]